MFEIKPWDEKSERILKQLSLGGRAFTHDMNFSKSFGRRLKTYNNDFIEIYHNRRKKKTCFVTPPDVIIKPKLCKTGIKYSFKKYHLFD